MSNEEFEVQCDSCGWVGDAIELRDSKCPNCGSDDVVDFDDEEVDSAGSE